MSTPHSNDSPQLTLVMPVFNEPRWVAVAARDAAAAAVASGFRNPEMVIVDDGSDEATQAVLASLELPIPLRVMRQTNQGRFRAREAGIRESYGELILLIDSRVSIAPGALRFVHGEAHGSAIHGAWNAHVNVLLEGNSFARFWNVLTEISFAEYFDNPRTTSFGEEDFDRFPKGTTCFLAPKDDLLKAIEAFESHFADPAMANDDTNLIRILARTERINISPNFACTYRSRNGFRPFLRHAHHRGVVFVDGFLRPGTRFLPVLIAFFPLSLATASWALRRFKRLAGVALAVSAAFGLLGLAKRRSAADVQVLTTLGPPWLIAYSLGIWRGLILAVRNRQR